MLGHDRLRLLLRYRPVSCAHSTSQSHNQTVRCYQTTETRTSSNTQSPRIPQSDRPSTHRSSKTSQSAKSASPRSTNKQTSDQTGKHRNYAQQQTAQHSDPSSSRRVRQFDSDRIYKAGSSWSSSFIHRNSSSTTVETDKHVFHKRVVDLVNAGSITQALNYFRVNQAHAREITWHTILNGLIDAQRYKDVDEVWKSWLSIIPPETEVNQIKQLKEDKLLPTAAVMSLLLRSQPSPFKPEQALEYLGKWGLPSDTFLHNSIVKELIKQHDFSRAAFFLKDMVYRNLDPDTFTIGLHLSLLKNREKQSNSSVHKSSRIGNTSQLWDSCVRCNLEPSVSMLISFMATFKETDDDIRTSQLVDYLVRTNVKIDALHIYYHILTVLMKRDRIDYILKMYEYFRNTGYPIDSLMFGIMITAFHRQRDLKSINMLYDEMVKSGVQPNAKIFNILLRTHAMFGDTQAMNEVFARMSDQQIEADYHTFDDIQRGICEWYWDIYSVQQERGSGGKKIDKNIRTEYELTPRELFATRTEPQMDESAYAIQLQPLSAYLLPWMHVMNERGVIKSERIYNRTLLALRRDEDTHSMLYYLNEMVDNGLPHSDMALSAVMDQLVNIKFFNAHERIAATQLMFLCDRLITQNVRFEPAAWECLLKILVKAENFADARQCYDHMINASCLPSAQTYRGLMSLSVTCDNVEEDEQERMRFVLSCYNDMRTAPRMKMFVDHFDLCLSAHAILGNTDGMKEVLSDMSDLSLSPQQSTMEVLEQARQHVAYTADMYNWISQQQTTLSITQVEPQAVEAPLIAVRSINQSFDIDPLALDTSSVETMFALPSWSPLADVAPVVPAAAILLNTLPLVQSSVIPSLKSTLELRRASESMSLSEQELNVIKQELMSLKNSWPGEPSSVQAQSTSQSTSQSINQSFSRDVTRAFRKHLPEVVEHAQLSPIDSMDALCDESINQSTNRWPFLPVEVNTSVPVPAAHSNDRSVRSSRFQRLSTGSMIGRPAFSFGGRAPPPDTSYVHLRSRTQRLNSGAMIGRAPESFGARFNIRYKSKPTMNVHSNTRSAPLVAPSTLMTVANWSVRPRARKPAVQAQSDQPKQPRRPRIGNAGLRSMRPDVVGFNGSWIREKSQGGSQ